MHRQRAPRSELWCLLPRVSIGVAAGGWIPSSTFDGKKYLLTRLRGEGVIWQTQQTRPFIAGLCVGFQYRGGQGPVLLVGLFFVFVWVPVLMMVTPAVICCCFWSVVVGCVSCAIYKQSQTYILIHDSFD